jgi:hypothetical protein
VFFSLSQRFLRLAGRLENKYISDVMQVAVQKKKTRVWIVKCLQIVPAFFRPASRPENTNPFQNVDTSVERMFFQVVPAFFRPAGKHKSISCRSIVQNVQVVPAFLLAGRPAGEHKSISCTSIVQNIYMSVECLIFK